MRSLPCSIPRSALNPTELERCWLSWITGLPEIRDGQVVAIDRKTLCRSSSLCRNRVPSGRRAIQSVNVPPTSIQNCQGSFKVDVFMAGFRKQAKPTSRFGGSRVRQPTEDTPKIGRCVTDGRRLVDSRRSRFDRALDGCLSSRTINGGTEKPASRSVFENPGLGPRESQGRNSMNHRVNRHKFASVESAGVRSLAGPRAGRAKNIKESFAGRAIPVRCSKCPKFVGPRCRNAFPVRQIAGNLFDSKCVSYT